MTQTAANESGRIDHREPDGVPRGSGRHAKLGHLGDGPMAT